MVTELLGHFAERRAPGRGPGLHGSRCRPRALTWRSARSLRIWAFSQACAVHAPQFVSFRYPLNGRSIVDRFGLWGGRVEVLLQALVLFLRFFQVAAVFLLEFFLFGGVFEIELLLRAAFDALILALGCGDARQFAFLPLGDFGSNLRVGKDRGANENHQLL